MAIVYILCMLQCYLQGCLCIVRYQNECRLQLQFKLNYLKTRNFIKSWKNLQGLTEVSTRHDDTPDWHMEFPQWIGMHVGTSPIPVPIKSSIMHGIVMRSVHGEYIWRAFRMLLAFLNENILLREKNDGKDGKLGKLGKSKNPPPPDPSSALGSSAAGSSGAGSSAATGSSATGLGSSAAGGFPPWSCWFWGNCGGLIWGIIGLFGMFGEFWLLFWSSLAKSGSSDWLPSSDPNWSFPNEGSLPKDGSSPKVPSFEPPNTSFKKSVVKKLIQRFYLIIVVYLPYSQHHQAD